MEDSTIMQKLSFPSGNRPLSGCIFSPSRASAGRRRGILFVHGQGSSQIEAVDRAKVGVCGASYGGYLAALVTAHREVRRLLLRAPSLAGDVDFPGRRREPSVSAEAPDGFDSLEILARYGGEVLVIESGQDEIIPMSHIAAYLRACSHAQHQVIPEAMHALTDPSWDEVFVKAIVRWFRDL